MSKNLTRRLAGGTLAAVVASTCLATNLPEASAATTAYVVAVGDSYPAGDMGNTHRAYPEWTGVKLSTRSTHMITRNRAHGGWITNDVLYDFDHSNTLAWVARANTVVITVGANDVLYRKPDASPAATSLASYRPAISQMQGNLNKILARVSAARHGHTGRVVVTGYNAIYNDGPAQKAGGATYVKGSDNVTKAVNAAIMASCHRYKMDCVDPFNAFQGSNVASLVIPDGTHPSLKGHQLYATLIVNSLRGRR